jgi:hypothetical protein
VELATKAKSEDSRRGLAFYFAERCATRSMRYLSSILYAGARLRRVERKQALLRKDGPMRLEEAYPGARVRVRGSYRKPELRGTVGTIVKRWGKPSYAAVEVRFDGGRSELFWRHELEEIQEELQGNVAWLRWG